MKTKKYKKNIIKEQNWPLKLIISQAECFKAVILANWEVEVEKMAVRATLGKKKDHISKITKAKRVDGVNQVVEHLPR
jgi:hypothetical protein